MFKLDFLNPDKVLEFKFTTWIDMFWQYYIKVYFIIGLFSIIVVSILTTEVCALLRLDYTYYGIIVRINNLLKYNTKERHIDIHLFTRVKYEHFNTIQNTKFKYKKCKKLFQKCCFLSTSYIGF